MGRACIHIIGHKCIFNMGKACMGMGRAWIFIIGHTSIVKMGRAYIGLGYW